MGQDSNDHSIDGSRTSSSAVQIGRAGFLRRRWRRCAVGLLLLVILWLSVSGVIAFRLTRRPRPRFEEPVPTVAWGPIEGHRLRTRDGQEIGTWFVEGEADAPAVILLHGNKGSRWNSLKRAEFLRPRGYSVLMVSLRAHGDSTGDYHDIGYSARHDVVAAVEFLERRRPGKPVIILGVSMGSAAAIFASAELGSRVRGYIFESPYQDLKVAVWNRTTTYLPPVFAQAAYFGLRTVGPFLSPSLTTSHRSGRSAASPRTCRS